MKNFFNSPKVLLILFSLFFAILPFFWLKPGEMDLGGDSNRLYFYDPISFLNYSTLSIVETYGLGAIDPTYYFIPYLLFLAGLKSIFQSSYSIISLFNILKLLGGFLAMYFVIYEILQIITKEKSQRKKVINKYAALLGGLFYSLSPMVTANWDKALTSHNQIFLNPLMFFLLLRFFVTHNFKYAWIGLFISILFAPNFGFTSAPPIFSFYPLAVLFLILFLKLQKVILPSWKKTGAVLLFFFGLHAFHYIPQIVSLFEPGSISNTRVFDRVSIMQEGVRYFIAVLPLAKVSNYLLLGLTNSLFYAIVPLLITLAFIINNKKQYIFYLTGGFFLFTLYLLSANITSVGVEFYKIFFYIPGFSMFRNFIGQWAMVYIFFYALLFAQAIRIIVNKFPKLNYSYVVLAIGLLFIFASWRFISGDAVRKGYVTNNVEIPIQMDQDYEQTLEYIRTLPDDSKMLMLPYTDAFYQVLAGENGGAYVGPSTIAYLTGRKTFTGYQTMPAEFSEKFLALAREKDYEGIKRFFGQLNIRYVFYNSDPRIYDDAFSEGPYTYMRESLPKTQTEYREFIPHIVETEIFHRGTYHIFTFSDDVYMPLFYTESEKARTPDIFFKRVNPTRYEVSISNAEDSYDLIFLNQYHPQWRIFLSDTTRDSLQTTVVYVNHAVQEGKHEDQFFVNPFETVGLKEIVYTKHTDTHDYANSWRITPEDVNGRKNYTIIVEMINQRIFYTSLIVSTIVFVVFIGWGVAAIIKEIYAHVYKKK